MAANSGIQDKVDVSLFLQSHCAGKKQRPTQGSGFHNGSRSGFGDYHVGGDHQLFHVIDESVHPGMLRQWVSCGEFPKKGLISSCDRQNGDPRTLALQFRNQSLQRSTTCTAAGQKNDEPIDGQSELPSN